MTCDCGAKMKCIFSAPQGQRVRYRVYKCGCGEVDESLEVPERNIRDESAKAALRRARESRFMFVMRFKKKG